jgi:hypothetical protein
MVAAVVPIRTVLLNRLEGCQRDLASYVEGVIAARERELTLARIWEGFFASPRVRAALEDGDAWEKIADLLTEVDPFSTGMRDAGALTESGARFDDSLAELNEKIEAARYDNADPTASADAVRRCLGVMRPTVKDIRVACQNGARETLSLLQKTTAQILEAVELQTSQSSGAPMTQALPTAKALTAEAGEEQSARKYLDADVGHEREKTM